MSKNSEPALKGHGEGGEGGGGRARPTWLLWSAADGERVPLVLGDDRDVDVDIIARFKVEELGTFDHQVSDLSTGVGKNWAERESDPAHSPNSKETRFKNTQLTKKKSFDFDIYFWGGNIKWCGNLLIDNQRTHLQLDWRAQAQSLMSSCKWLKQPSFVFIHEVNQTRMSRVSRCLTLDGSRFTSTM